MASSIAPSKTSTKTQTPRDVFSPLTKPEGVPTTKVENSSQIVTLPAFPELFNEKFLDAILPPSATKAAPAPAPASDLPKNAFMSALKEEGNKMLTDNMSPAFKSTLDPALDLFSAAANAEGTKIHDLLHKSWNSNPDLTLRLIFSLRSIHDGKSEQKTFYHAFGWLYKNHPRTAIGNLNMLVEPVVERAKKKKDEEEKGTEEDWMEVEEGGKEKRKEIDLPGYSHGYYKDLLNILVLAVNDQLISPDSNFAPLYTDRPWWSHESEPKRKAALHKSSSDKPSIPKAKRQPRGNRDGPRDPNRVTNRQLRAQRTTVPPTPEKLKVEAAKEQHERLLKHLSSSPEFKALYVAVARLFGTKLAEEIQYLQKLNEGNLKGTLTDDERIELIWKIGLVGKWAPTLHGSHDRHTNISTAIALVLHSLGAMSALPVTVTPKSTLSVQDADKVRGYYRRWIISPLRRQAYVPESFIGANKWQSIRYDRVPAVCMKQSKKLFYRHDQERFQKYLEDVSKGKRSIAGATLLPHQLVGEAVSLAEKGTNDPEAEVNLKVVEGQWKSLVERLRESGALGNSMAVCDVSGSMGSLGYGRRRSNFDQPIYPAIALSLLVALLAKPPFANTFITFSADPSIVEIDPTQGLVQIANNMSSADWGMNTDLQAVFLKLILPLAIKHKVPKGDMIKRLFIFSDMQFDACRSNGRHGDSWTTDHQAITQAYTAAGYDVPDIIYWNLSSYSGASKPVLGDTPGVALLAGLSGNLLKLFLDNSEEELAKQLEEFAIVDENGNETAEKPEKKGMTPIDVMMKALYKKSYDGLKVLD